MLGPNVNPRPHAKFTLLQTVPCLLALLTGFAVPIWARAELTTSRIELPKPPLKENSNSKAPPEDPAPELPTGVAPDTVVRGEVVSLLNADRIHHRENRVAFVRNIQGRRFKLYGAEAVQVRGLAPWVDFDGFKATAFADAELAPGFLLSASLGAGALTLHQFQSARFETKNSVPLYRLKAVYTPIERTDLRFETNQDFAYLGWRNRDGLGNVQTLQNYFAEVETFSLPGWQIRTNARLTYLADHNRQHAIDQLILRDILTAPFLLRFGVGGNLMGYKYRAPTYFSPPRLSEFGLRLYGEKQFGRHWATELRLKAGYHREAFRPREQELTAEAMLKYVQNKRWLVQLSGNFFDANKGAWWRRDLALKLK